MIQTEHSCDMEGKGMLDESGSLSLSLKYRPVMEKKELRSWSVHFEKVVLYVPVEK